jgi:hypothetical protein
MKRPSNTTLVVATLWAAALVSSNYVWMEMAGWATMTGVLIAANFKAVR